MRKTFEIFIIHVFNEIDNLNEKHYTYLMECIATLITHTVNTHTHTHTCARAQPRMVVLFTFQ